MLEAVVNAVTAAMHGLGALGGHVGSCGCRGHWGHGGHSSVLGRGHDGIPREWLKLSLGTAVSILLPQPPGAGGC